jgi:hypothetical protein
MEKAHLHRSLAKRINPQVGPSSRLFAMVYELIPNIYWITACRQRQYYFA